jgi:hypothetical protein
MVLWHLSRQHEKLRWPSFGGTEDWPVPTVGLSRSVNCDFGVSHMFEDTTLVCHIVGNESYHMYIYMYIYIPNYDTNIIIYMVKFANSPTSEVRPFGDSYANPISIIFIIIHYYHYHRIIIWSSSYGYFLKLEEPKVTIGFNTSRHGHPWRLDDFLGGCPLHHLTVSYGKIIWGWRYIFTIFWGITIH